MAARRNAVNRHVASPVSDRAGSGASKKTRQTASPVVARAADLDRLIHDRTRLAIVSALAASATLSFTELKSLLDLSDGNLSVHARKLEDAGYLTCTKGFEGRLPKTRFTLTDAGHRALRQYLDHMEAIIKHARVKGR
ncbi:MAG TPA: transcriptional regulator [Vicinamibacterales bacterium]|nr:transcriptional regulator [Vicinamibacterales bacterium]